LQAFSCGEADGGYVVTNIDLDDANAGLMVREGPSLQFIGRPIPANSTGVAINAACNFATDTWCQVQCKSRSLSGVANPLSASEVRCPLYDFSQCATRP